MRKIFLRQQKRGGIIDVEAEKNKFLIATKVQLLFNYNPLLILKL